MNQYCFLKNIFSFNWLKVFRIKEVIVGASPFLIASLDTQIILEPAKFLLLVTGFLSIFFSSFLINELIDSEDTDKFNPEREKGITRHGVSKKFTFWAFVITSILGIILLNFLNLGLIGVFGFLLLTAYSVPPIRLKARPFLDLIAVTIGFALLPYLSYLYLVGAAPNVFVLLFFTAGFMAIDLVAEGADFDADKQANILTTAVFLGEKRNLIFIEILTFLGTILGILAIIITGYWWYMYIIFIIIFLFTAVKFGLTICDDKERLHELLRTGEKFGIFVSNLGLGILLLIWIGWILKNWLL